VSLGLRIARIGNRSFALDLDCSDVEQERVRIRQSIVTTSLDTHRPIPVPPDLRAAMARFDPGAGTRGEGG
jgi:4-hydroxybenzoyl-CoA thioesterase